MRIVKKWSLLFLPVFLTGCISMSEESSEEKKSDDVTVEQPEESSKSETVDKPEKKEVKVVKPKLKTEDGKLILGAEEWVYLTSLDENVKARIDSGATTSSISATDIQRFERDGKDWVRFKFSHGDYDIKEFSAPVSRFAKISQSSSKETVRRPVIMMWIQLGDEKVNTEFTLADRTHMDYPVLLGRSFFRDIAMIDTSKKFIQPKWKK